MASHADLVQHVLGTHGLGALLGRALLHQEAEEPLGGSAWVCRLCGAEAHGRRSLEEHFEREHVSVAEARKRLFALVAHGGPRPVPWSRARRIVHRFDEALRTPGHRGQVRAQAACVVCARLWWCHELRRVELFGAAPDPVDRPAARPAEGGESPRRMFYEAEPADQGGRGPRQATQLTEGQQERLCELLCPLRYVERWPHLWQAPENRAELLGSCVWHPRRGVPLLLHQRRVPLKAHGETEEARRTADESAASDVCPDCWNALGRAVPVMPRYALANDNWLGRMPAELADLSDGCRRLLPRARCCVDLVVLHGAGQPSHLPKQRGLLGNHILLPQSTPSEVLGALPPVPGESDGLARHFGAVFVDRVDGDLSGHRVFSVARGAYERAVRCLQRTSPMYANVDLCARRLSTLPESAEASAPVLAECCTVDPSLAGLAASLRQEGPADAVWTAEEQQEQEHEEEADAVPAPASPGRGDAVAGDVAEAPFAAVPDAVALIGQSQDEDEPLRFLRLAEEWRALVTPDRVGASAGRERSLASAVMERRLQNRLHRGEAAGDAGDGADSGRGALTAVSAGVPEEGGGGAEAAELPLLGRDRVLERRAHEHVRLIKDLAARCGRAEYERQLQRSVQAVHPQVLAVPVTGEPLSSFDPRTLPMAMPELFPYGDGAPFLDRRTPMTLQEWARMLLMREELSYRPLSVERAAAYGSADEPPPTSLEVEQYAGSVGEPELGSGAAAADGGPVVAPRPSRWRQSVLFVPVVYDMVRRLELMRAVKLHVNRRGFGKAVRDLQALTPEDILACIHAAGSGADLRTIMTNQKVPATVREAAKAMILSTGRVLGTEGHRTEMRHRLNALALQYGHAHVFVTPNLSDTRCPLFVALHGGPGACEDRGWEVWDLDWTAEAPSMPSALQMLQAIAEDCVAQAQLFDVMMELFFRVVLGVDGVLRREYGQPYQSRLHEDPYAASVLGGCFGDVACAMGPIETQGRGSLHPHTLVVLLGHESHGRLRALLACRDGRAAAEQLRAWGRLVLEAARRIQYECQEEVARDLGCAPAPLPLSLRQRRLAGAAYEDAPLVPAERDVAPEHEGSGEPGGASLTGCVAAVLPAYRRAGGEDLDAAAWSRAFANDHRRLVIHNHLHKCGKSCFKKQPVGPKGLTTCRFGCFHFETVEEQPVDARAAVCKRRRRAGWPPRAAAGFLAKADDEQSLYVENPYVGKLAPVRRHPFEGPTHPVPQVAMRSNVDVKYLGRSVAEADLDRLVAGVARRAAGGSGAARASSPPAKRRRLGREHEPGRGEVDPEGWDALRQEVLQAFVAVERDLKSTQHYVGEYATKKFAAARDILPQVHAGLARLGRERAAAEDGEDLDAAGGSARAQRWAYRTLLRIATSMQRCVAKSRCEMAYQLLFERECFTTHVPYVMYVRFPVHAARQERCADPTVDAPALEEADAAVPVLGVVEEAEVGEVPQEEPPAQEAEPGAVEVPDAVEGDEAADGGPRRKARRVTRRLAFGDGTSQKDDFVHRGPLAPLAQMGLYVYSRCVRRLPKSHVASRATGYVFAFAAHYAMSEDHVQELRLADVPVQPAGLYVPPAAERPEENALVRLALFSPRPCCEGGAGAPPCAGTTHWRLHGRRGFLPELRRHLARRAVLVARAEPRLLSGLGGVATHDTWSSRCWHPGGATPADAAELLARSWQVREVLQVACLRAAAGRVLPPRAWERVVWCLGVDGLQPPPPLLAEPLCQQDEVHVGHHFAQLTAEEFVAVLEDRFDQQLELQVAARGARQGTRTLRADLHGDDVDDDLGCADADLGAVTVEVEEGLPGATGHDADEEGERRAGFPLVPAEVLRTALRETQWRAAEGRAVGRPAAGSMRAGLAAMRTVLRRELDRCVATEPVLSGCSAAAAGCGSRASCSVKPVRLGVAASAAKAQTAAALALLPEDEDVRDEQGAAWPDPDGSAVPAALPEDPLPALVPGTLPGQESPAVYGARLVELAKLNATQLRAVAPVVLAVQRLWEQRTREDADVADGPAGRQLVCLWLGAGGSGKTWAYTQVLRPLFLRYFGARGVLAMAPTHPAAMLLGRGAVTMHRAAGADFQQSWDPARLAVGGQALKRLRDLWVPVRVAVLDEVSLARPDVYYGTSARALYARQRTEQLDVDAHGTQPFGRVPVVIHIGDFLQMRPPGRRSLCEAQAEDGEPEDPADDQGEDGSTADELGRRLFRDNLTHVVQFTGTGRFQDTASGRQLVAVLECMRSGAPLSDELWTALRARVVDDRRADPRLAEARFAEGHEGATRWELVARLQHLRAAREAREAGRRLWYVQAIDTPVDPGVDWTRGSALEALEVVSMVATGYLMGLCPLYVGMYVRLTGNLAKAVLVRELRGHVEELWLHPDEPPDARQDGRGLPPVLLRYMPTGVLVRLEDPSLAHVRFAPELPPGRILVPSVQVAWAFMRPVAVDGRRPRKVTTRLHRRQMPLAPALVNTQYGLQGQTARRGMTAYLYTATALDQPEPGVAPGKAQQDYWLSVYVLLSRPTQLDDLLIVGLPPRHLFSWGPPAGIARRLAAFDALGDAGRQVSDEAVAALGWPAPGEEVPQPDVAAAAGERVAAAGPTSAQPAVPQQRAASSVACPRGSAAPVRLAGTGASRPVPCRSAASAGDVPEYLRTEHFERQEGAHCGLHALNNVLGAQRFRRADLLAAARVLRMQDVFSDYRVPDGEAAGALEPVLAQEALAVLGLADEDVLSSAAHAADGVFQDVGPDGNYSFEVLAQALEATEPSPVRSHAWSCAHRALACVQSTLEFRIGGLVSHVGVDTLELQEVAGALVHLPTGHWTAVRHVRGQWWLLDSLSAAPQPLNRAAAHAYLTRHAAAYQVLDLGPAVANQPSPVGP